MRPHLKRLLEGFLLGAGPARASSFRMRGRVLILAYHNILPDGKQGEGDRALHLPRHAFAAQLDQLMCSHEIVPLETLLLPRGKRSSRPRAVITFDDAYRGAVTVGLEELRKRSLPATIFVAPAFIGNHPFWWDVLAGWPSGLPSAVREQALTTHRGMDPEVREWAKEEGLPLITVAQHARAATEDELSSAVAGGNITVGSHTWNHPNLARLSSAELRSELIRPMEWLRQRFTRFIPWLSYPYGIASPAVEATAAAVGYQAALMVEGGWVPRHLRSRYAIPRLNVPAGISLEGFALRSAGLFCN